MGNNCLENSSKCLSCLEQQQRNALVNKPAQPDILICPSARRRKKYIETRNLPTWEDIAYKNQLGGLRNIWFDYLVFSCPSSWARNFSNRNLRDKSTQYVHSHSNVRSKNKRDNNKHHRVTAVTPLGPEKQKEKYEPIGFYVIFWVKYTLANDRHEVIRIKS